MAGQPRIAAAFATSSTTSDAPGCAETTLSASWNLLGDAYPISDDDEEAEQGSTTQASSVDAKEKKATVRSVPGRRQEYDKDRYQSKKDNIITNMKRAWMECNLIFGYHCRFCIKLHPSMRGKDSFSKGYGLIEPVDGEGEELRPKPISHEQKVREHEKKKEHLYAVKEFDKQQPKDTVVMPNFMERTSSELLYARTVRTVHTMCIKQFALSSANALLDLQWANGLVISYDHVHTGGELGSGGLTDWLEAGARVFAAIERDRAANSVARTVFPDGLLFGFMGDGSNDRSLMEREAVALRYIGPDGMPYNTLFDLGTLDLKESVDGFSPDAKCITACYVNSLKALDLHDGFLRQSSWQASVVAGSFDGASVMLGSQKGVAAKMKDLVPHMVFVHAAAHVQQLAMADAFQICEYFDKWRKTVQEVYVYYRLSGKKAFSLSQIAEQIGDDLLKLRGTHGIRWAASQHKSIEALLQDLNAIIIDLEMAAKREVGLELTSLSPSELFVKRQFTQLWEDEAGGRPRRWRATVTKILPSELGAVYDRFELKYSDRSTSQVSKAELIDLITDGDRLKDSPVYILRADISTTRFVLFSVHDGCSSPSGRSLQILSVQHPADLGFAQEYLQDGPRLAKAEDRPGSQGGRGAGCLRPGWGRQHLQELQTLRPQGRLRWHG